MTTAIYYLVSFLLVYCVYLTFRLGEVILFLNTLYEKTIELEVEKRVQYICNQNKENFNADRFIEKFKK